MGLGGFHVGTLASWLGSPLTQWYYRHCATGVAALNDSSHCLFPSYCSCSPYLVGDFAAAIIRAGLDAYRHGDVKVRND